MGILGDFISAFLPFCCHSCRQATIFGEVLCAACFEKFSRSLKEPLPVNDTVCNFPVFTLSQYDSFVADIIRLIKYRPSRKLAGYVDKVLQTKQLLKSFGKSELIFVPVPMHKARLFQRGFNQAELLSESMARHCCGISTPALTRIFATVPQASCTEEQRLKNLEGAIMLADGLIPEKFHNRDLVIVDDVATTGTTLEQCYQKLLLLKPASVRALVLSHSFRKLKE